MYAIQDRYPKSAIETVEKSYVKFDLYYEGIMVSGVGSNSNKSFSDYVLPFDIKHAMEGEFSVVVSPKFAQFDPFKYAADFDCEEAAALVKQVKTIMVPYCILWTEKGSQMTPVKKRHEVREDQTPGDLKLRLLSQMAQDGKISDAKDELNSWCMIFGDRAFDEKISWRKHMDEHGLTGSNPTKPASTSTSCAAETTRPTTTS